MNDLSLSKNVKAYMKIKIIIALIALMTLGGAIPCMAQGRITRPSKQKRTKTETVSPKPQKSGNATPAKTWVSNPDAYCNNHGYVDLGLPSGTKWATCNIGSLTSDGVGTYFAWGETAPKSTYTQSNAKYLHVGDGGLMQNGVLTPAQDAAYVNWGAPWRMPTREQMRELVDRCKWRWDEAHVGMIVTGPNGKSIFLPASGSMLDDKYNFDPNNPEGCLWTSTGFDSFNHQQAGDWYFGKNSGKIISAAERTYGFNIRPVVRRPSYICHK